jgi:hypothetical protein
MIPIKIKLTDERPPYIGARKFSDFCKEAFEEAGAYWHDELLPLRFTTNNPGLRFVEPRSKQWLRRKAGFARAGLIPAENVPVPNLFSGTLRDSLKEGLVRAYPTRVRIIMQAPVYAPMRPRRRPDKIKELFTLTYNEIRDISSRLNRKVGELLNKYREKHEIEI